MAWKSDSSCTNLMLFHKDCSAGNRQKCFSLVPNQHQPPASQQYFSHSQPNRVKTVTMRYCSIVAISMTPSASGRECNSCLVSKIKIKRRKQNRFGNTNCRHYFMVDLTGPKSLASTCLAARSYCSCRVDTAVGPTRKFRWMS